MKLKKRILIGILVFLSLLGILLSFLSLADKNVRTNNLGVKYFNKGDFKSAGRIFDDEIKKGAENSIVINNSAGADYKLNKLGEAQAKYTAVINSAAASKEDKFTALYGMGNIKFLENRFEESLDFYKEALKLNPDDKDAKFNLELALLKLDKRNNMHDNKQNEERERQKKQEHDLKKQMEQNEKAQSENEKKYNSRNGSTENSDFRKDADRRINSEMEKLDKQKQDISSKIRDLIDGQKNMDQVKNKQAAVKIAKQLKKENQKKDEDKYIQQNQKERSGSNNIQAVTFLNYYNEADKNSSRPNRRNKKPLVNQPQENW